MQIRLVIGVQDDRYLNRLVTYLERNYMDKLEIFSFSKPELLRDYFSHGGADVILADETFGLTAEELRGYGRAAFLADTGNSTDSDGIRRIVKYKKPELIYKDILDLYAEGGRRQSFRSGNDQSGQMILVTGFSGGTGASTFAAALAKMYASRGRKVLYVNLETAGMSSDFFSGNGDYHFEDVIFALKSQRTDVRLKMESAMRRDASGVSFFAPCTNAMYMLELNHEDTMKILSTVASGIGYDYVVFDMNFHLDQKFVEIMGFMDRIILVQDGAETSNSKFCRTMEALRIIEEQSKQDVIGNMQLLYNRFSSSKSSSEIPGLRIPVLGKVPPIKHALVREIIEYMLNRPEIFETL